MPRLPLFEFEDQPWFPPVLRAAVTGYLRVIARLTRQVAPVVPGVAKLLRASGESRILDLCSGSGGVAAELAAGLAAQGLDVEVLLTDLYPDAASLAAAASSAGGRVAVRAEPLDATAVPADLAGLRTMFNAFHHFEPDDARRILADAAAARRPIAVVEFVERNLFTLSGIVMSPLLVMLTAPLVRPLRPLALALTWLVPVVPLVVFWDGLASWLRVYSLRELEQLASRAGAERYGWEAGHWRVGPVRVTYLLGCPR